MARNLGAQGRHTEAELLQRELVKEMQRCPSMGPAHLRTLLSMYFRAEQLCQLGRHEEAAELHRQTWEIRRRPAVLGPTHRHTLDSMHSLAMEEGHLGNHAASAALYEEVLKLRQQTGGPAHQMRVESAKGLIEQLKLSGQHSKAAAYQLQLDDGKL